jgi:glyoxylase-like metal-dependent hydrolase (beta-lactamase superfamily II)
MINIHYFAFNGFQENTYILFDETKECLIIDPGCYSSEEHNTLSNYIKENDLTPIKLLNTHCHVDHILGNNYVASTYNIGLEIHENEVSTLHAAPEHGRLYGFNLEESPEPTTLLKDADEIQFGNSKLEVRFAPGHCAGHVAFVGHEDKFVICGDILFHGSIGRTDLPGGDYNTLINSIKTKLLTLDDDFKVYSGHGPSTNIGFERKNNPFLNQ